MTTPAAFFNAPLDPARSIQLNNRYWPGDRFEHLEMIREAEEDVVHRRYGPMRRSVGRVKALLEPQYRRSFVSRLVYSVVFQTSFNPIKFSVKLSDDFVAANTYSGPDALHYKADVAYREELRHLVDFAHSIYRNKYGRDILTSGYEVRYINASNPNSRRRITQYGEFSDYHLDSGKDFTCIIYLGRVQPQNGCFTYVEGSNDIPKSHVLRALHQVVHLEMKLSTPDEVAGLPLEMRGGMNVGDYLEDAKAERLRDFRVELLGDVGDGLIFNGFDTLHRGGQPLEGHRTAVFIGTKGLVTSRLRKSANDLLASLWL
jgi:hypothetical protein